MNKCLRCENSWIPRKQTISPRCPKCGSSTWNRPEEEVMKKKRKCPLCGQNFKPMANNLWEINEYQHFTMSERHKEHLLRKFLPIINDLDAKLTSLQMLKELENNYFVVCFDGLTKEDISKIKDRFQAKSGEPWTHGKHNIIVIDPIVGNRPKFQYWA